MNVASLYQSKLTTPDQAAAPIPSGSRLSMGMEMAGVNRRGVLTLIGELNY